MSDNIFNDFTAPPKSNIVYQPKLQFWLLLNIQNYTSSLDSTNIGLGLSIKIMLLRAQPSFGLIIFHTNMLACSQTRFTLLFSCNESLLKTDILLHFLLLCSIFYLFKDVPFMILTCAFLESIIMKLVLFQLLDTRYFSSSF